MNRLRIVLLATAVFAAPVLIAQSPFPQTLQPNTVVGRLSISAGPAQQIPFANLSAALIAAGFTSGITTLTGDVAASGTGSVAATLATVNAGPGSVGSSTAIPVLTTNGKGLVTAQATAAVVAPAGTLTGTVLASNIVTSSLTAAAGGNFGTFAYQSFATPPAIGGTTPAAGAFTTLSATGAATIPGLLVSRIAYTASGTITIAGTKALIHMGGATGGSGGASAAVTIGATGGTGAGCALYKYLSGLTVGNTLTYTLGTGGAAGTNAGGNGGNGAAATLASGTQTITTLTCNGSNGSVGITTNTNSAGTVGGTAVNGDTNVAGQNGSAGVLTLFNVTPTAGPFPITLTYGTYPGLSGSTDLSVGAQGVVGSGVATAGNAGNNSTLMIEWFQ